MSTPGHLVRLQFCSAFDMLDFVQLVSDHLCRRRRFRRRLDALGGRGRARVGHQRDQAREPARSEQDGARRFPSTVRPDGELVISVSDEGEGFEPEEVADPLAPENMLKSSGRGIFLMRSFMDDVALAEASRGRHGSAHDEAGREGGRIATKSRVEGSKVRSKSQPCPTRRLRAAFALCRFPDTFDPSTF